MIVRSKAPFRLGLAGGGTDVSPYSDEYGGAILNATVNLYAHTTLVPRSDGKIILRATDLDKEFTLDATNELEINGELDLQKGVYNRIVKTFTNKPLSFELTTKMDVPSGSGLGTSSTLVVSILGAFIEWLQLDLTEYEIARLAFSIEREDLSMAGGKQDQYAAVFGGINFLKFGANNEVIVHPLDISKALVNELEVNLLLFYTKTSRESSKIILIQAENVQKKQSKPINAMHLLKEQAFAMKDALINGDLKAIGQILNTSWRHKKMMADGISNPVIDTIYNTAMEAGAVGGKISGAGGGGFMIFYVNDADRTNVIKQLHTFNGEIKHFEFCFAGLTTWTIHE